MAFNKSILLYNNIVKNIKVFSVKKYRLIIMTVKSENLKNFELESLILLKQMVEIKKKIQDVLTKFQV